MFQTILKALKISGLFIDQTALSSKICSYKLYCYFTIVIGVYGFIAIIHGGFVSENLPYFLIVGCMQIWVLFDSVFFLAKEQHIRQVLDNITLIDEMFENNLLPGTFVQKAITYNTRVQFYMNLYIISQSILPLFNFIFKNMRYLGMFGLDGELTYIIPPVHHQNFKEHHPLFYMLDLTLQTIVLTYELLKQSATDCFFMSIFLHTSHYFEHLQCSFIDIFNKAYVNTEKLTLTYFRLRCNIDSVMKSVESLTECGEETFTQQLTTVIDYSRVNQHYEEDKLKTWAVMHQKVLKLSQELISLYNPMLMVQFSLMFFLLVVLVFMVTTQEAHDAIEVILSGMYFVMIMSVFFAMCLVGDKLHNHSGRVSELFLSSPWYLSTKGVHKSLLIIGERSRKQLRISVFNSKIFFLSSSTFISIMKSVVTVYIALVQINNHSLYTAAI